MADERREVKLPAGTIRYREAGEGKPIVFVHGYLVDGRLWQGVVDRLSDRFRCLAPDWPFGAHHVAMEPDADLSPPGLARLIADFLDELDLEDVTIVGNDSGGAISQVLVANHPQRIGRLVLTNCDTHENFPPGIFKAMPPLAKLPGSMPMVSAVLRLRGLTRLTFTPFARTKIPNELVDSWTRASIDNRQVRHDLKKVTIGLDKRHTLEAAEKLRGTDLPIRFLWAPSDRYFPISYAERLAGEVGNAEIVQIEDAKTFVPLDQPQRVAEEVARYVG
ncbi:MAG TPA: alpha/beta hydrolase [Solirubrobacterales bacterium]|nr:alpha/beta hydrolase [Solirubrobacterales bacterium]